MCTEALEKYLESFKVFVPFILVKLVFQISSFEVLDGNMLLNQYSFIRKENLLTNITSSIWNSIGMALVTIFLAPLLYSFLNLVIKNVLKEEEVNYKDGFKESLGFYLRYLGLTIIIIFILGGVSLCSFVAIIHPIFIIGVVILKVYVTITIIPCLAYLIYYNTSVEDALSKGRAIGKKYFWSILFVEIIAGVINIIVENIIKYSGFSNNVIVFAIATLIAIVIEFYICVFAMYICMEEEPVLQSTENREQSTENRE